MSTDTINLGAYHVNLRFNAHRDGVSATLVRTATGSHLGHNYAKLSLDAAEAWATTWAKKRVRAVEAEEAILASRSDAAQRLAYAHPRGWAPSPGTLAKDPAPGSTVTIHAAGSWRRAVTHRTTGKRVKVVWAAPSTGRLHVKSVPRDEVYNGRRSIEPRAS